MTHEPTPSAIRVMCKTCGGFDLCEFNGKYIEKHVCEHPNKLLLRIAEALEKIAKDMK